jgi:hypothetical protein
VRAYPIPVLEGAYSSLHKARNTSAHSTATGWCASIDSRPSDRMFGNGHGSTKSLDASISSDDRDLMRDRACLVAFDRHHLGRRPRARSSHARIAYIVCISAPGNLDRRLAPD